MIKNDALQLLLERSIRRGIKFITEGTEEERPTMVMDRTGTYLCINAYARYNDDICIFDEYLNTFNSQCLKYKLQSLNNTNPEIFSEKIDIGAGLIKYHFYIKPDDFHMIFMNEWEIYARYRDNRSVLSIYNPQQLLLKKDVICLFPVQEVGNNEDGNNVVFIRNAGCNITNTIVYQLESFLKPFFPKAKGSTGEHNQSPYLHSLGIAIDILYGALQSFFQIKGVRFSFQIAEGQIFFTLTDNIKHIMQPMNPEAFAIYSNFSAEMPQNLHGCCSMEMPFLLFLKQIALTIDRRIENEQSDLALQLQTNDNPRLIKTCTERVEDWKNTKETFHNTYSTVLNKLSFGKLEKLSFFSEPDDAPLSSPSSTPPEAPNFPKT